MTMSENMHVCAEVQYETPEGNCHSDLCMDRDGNDFSLNVDQGAGITWRQFLHQALDEWLDRSNGTGYFTVGNAHEDCEEK
jgi:hypothetical protein